MLYGASCRIAFQSTPPGWEATLRGKEDGRRCSISIHASRVGGDKEAPLRRRKIKYFNPRLPGGRRPAAKWQTALIPPFQSTPPGWEATIRARSGRGCVLFQSTPPGWEATYSRPSKFMTQAFQSTPPGWEATSKEPEKVQEENISIHASRVGGDNGSRRRHLAQLNFNPRLPGGRRRQFSAFVMAYNPFQSTPPGWEATARRAPV